MNFDTAFDRVLGHEGGYVNNPKDPGGETNWGISKRRYPHTDIKNLSRNQAKELYRRDFWEPLQGDRLPDGVAFQTFDFAVNSGRGTAIRGLQRAVGVADDGTWGPVSQSALERLNESDVLMRLAAERLDFMTRLSTWPSFGRGWARRIAANLRYGAEDS